MVGFFIGINILEIRKVILGAFKGWDFGLRLTCATVNLLFIVLMSWMLFFNLFKCISPSLLSSALLSRILSKSFSNGLKWLSTNSHIPLFSIHLLQKLKPFIVVFFLWLWKLWYFLFSFIIHSFGSLLLQSLFFLNHIGVLMKLLCQLRIRFLPHKVEEEQRAVNINS